MKSLLQPIAYLTGIIAALILATALYTNHTMYGDIEEKLQTSSELRQAIGKFQKASLYSDGDCAWENVCYLRFKVQGDHECVYAKAQVEESFPIYRMISVSIESTALIHVDNLGKVFLMFSFRSAETRKY